MDQLGVKISLPKSLISRRGALEFAKKFLILGKDLSPISMKMLRSVTYPVAWMPVCKSVGVSSLRTSLRLRGAGYRRYSSQPHHFNPHYNRHWFRHVLVCFSPHGIVPLPFKVWLGYPEGFLPSPSQVGMIREYLLKSCAPDWSYAQKIANDLDALDDDTGLLVESSMMVSWVKAMCKYIDWCCLSKSLDNVIQQGSQHCSYFIVIVIVVVGPYSVRSNELTVARSAAWLLKRYSVASSKQLMKPVPPLSLKALEREEPLATLA
ncbi:hypothetical protein CKAN_02721200 [Cinnamomum micranthum f. kanehirae]|uniref:Uncharacterized protein n=1 Tax=Cinnamomum micranthum f. kanehirae TaxID=337451 RepID=A0A3S3NZZ5_9MAGN|nr:hypothetical protein CKAN_02721200 [Cinnamomum micranthum f. kanehirae]